MPIDLTPLDFDDTELIELPVRIKDKTYTLREANGEASIAYQNASAASLVWKDGKIAGTKGAGNVESLLVSLCLFDAQGIPVPEPTIRKWPSRIQKTLFDRIKAISGLSEESDLEELRKQREDLDRRIKLAENEESPAGNEQDGYRDGSV